MASNKRTIYLGLDYSQFSGGVTEINRKMGLLDAEFKLAQQQAKNYGNETDQTGVKIDYLSQKIALQNQKVEEAKKAYEDAKNSNTASQKEIDALNKRLITETTNLEGLNGQLKQTKTDTDKVSTSNVNMGEVFSKVKEVVSDLANKMKDLSMSFANTGDELLTLSAQTGLTTTELQELQYASKFLDVSVDTLTSSTTKLVRSMNSARDGSGDAAEAFKKLHVRITDNRGALRDQNDVFNDVIDKLGKVKNETERDALAMEIFGRSAKDLNPLIKAGAEELDKYKQKAHEVGAVMSEDAVQAAGKLKDSMDRLDSVFDAAKNKLAEAFAPILEKIVNLLSKMDPTCLAIIGTIITLAAAFMKVATVMKTLSVATALQATMQEGFNGISIKTVAIVLAVAAAIAIVVAIIGLLIGKTEEVGQATDSAMNKVGNAGNKINTSLSGYQTRTNNATGRNASGTEYWEGGETWVGEEGPELVNLPRGSRITPASEAARSEVNNYYITIDAKNVRDFNHVVELAKNMPMAARRV